jgi:hypothetical protein
MEDFPNKFQSLVAEIVAMCNVWSSVKANRPSVNKYANLTWHSSSLLDLDSDIGCPLLGLSLSAQKPRTSQLI